MISVAGVRGSRPSPRIARSRSHTRTRVHSPSRGSYLNRAKPATRTSPQKSSADSSLNPGLGRQTPIRVMARSGTRPPPMPRDARSQHRCDPPRLPPGGLRLQNQSAGDATQGADAHLLDQHDAPRYRVIRQHRRGAQAVDTLPVYDGPLSRTRRCLGQPIAIELQKSVPSFSGSRPMISNSLAMRKPLDRLCGTSTSLLWNRARAESSSL